ncbi:MAG: molybdenum cofactor guanylyltransferase [Dehalococcoidia bacterium]|nr:molybdenum cofactor guanylyltransferase [Dehalococcoidia bacterium]
MAEPDLSPLGASNLAALVLAGGQSTRLGKDKAFLDIDGRTLLERVTARLHGLFREILVVTSQRGREQIRENGLEFSREVSLITDLYPGKGSMGGVYSGLVLSSTYYNLVVACDMPFLSPRLVAHLTQQAQDFDVIIPRLKGVLEPLHAIYSKGCLGPMKRLLDVEHLKIIDLFPEVNVRYIEEAEIVPLDPQLLSFFNINTAIDFQRAQEMEASLKSGN